jgi:hypothetical protein
VSSHIKALLVAPVLASCGQAYAQPPPSAAGPAELPEIRVIAGRDWLAPAEPPIDQLSPLEVSSFGVDSVTELLDQLKPRTASSMSTLDPIVLVNGRVAGSTELDNLPPEAILRVDILAEKSALRYGFDDSQRVVNIVLRESFRGGLAGLSDRQATEGGGQSGAGEASLTRINHDAEDTLRLDYKESERLLESARGIDSVDSDLRTLLPQTSEAKLGATFVRQVLGLRPSLEASVDVKSSDSLQGLASEGALSPVQTATLAAIPGAPLLKQHVAGTTLHVAARVTGPLGKFIWSLAATGNESGSNARVNANGIVAPGSVVLDRSDYTLDTGRLDASIGGPLLTLPAGLAVVNVHLDTQVERIRTHAELPGAPDSATHLSRTTDSAQVRARIPLTSPDRHVLGFAGELTGRLSFGVDEVSQFGSLDSYGYGLTWNPLQRLYLNADFTATQLAPSVQDLFGPAIFTPGVQMFDFVRGATVYITQITGGDPDLKYTARRAIRLGVYVGPFAGNSSCYANFEHRRDGNAVGLLPALTAQVEEAFPERFIRDDTGTLIEVDDRSLNLALQARDVATWGINLGLPFSQPQGDGALRLMLSLQDSWYFEDTILVRNGVPALDLLNGAPLGAVSGGLSGAQPRNTLQLWAIVNYRALGAQLSGRWHSASYVNGGAPSAPDSLSFSALGTANLRVFADLGRMLRGSAAEAWSKGLRVSLAVTNLLDARQRVVDSSGATPVGFEPSYIDPIGRALTLSLRKVF